MSIKSGNNGDNSKGGRDQKSIKIIKPVAATTKIDLGFLDRRAYTDGISEQHLDK